MGINKIYGEQKGKSNVWNNKDRVHRIALAVGITILTILLAVCASAEPLSGEWKGSTSQGKEVNFIVNNFTISTFNITIECGWSVNVSTPWNTPIVNG